MANATSHGETHTEQIPHLQVSGRIGHGCDCKLDVAAVDQSRRLAGVHRAQHKPCSRRSEGHVLGEPSQEDNHDCIHCADSERYFAQARLEVLFVRERPLELIERSSDRLRQECAARRRFEPVRRRNEQVVAECYSEARERRARRRLRETEATACPRYAPLTIQSFEGDQQVEIYPAQARFWPRTTLAGDHER